MCVFYVHFLLGIRRHPISSHCIHLDYKVFFNFEVALCLEMLILFFFNNKGYYVQSASSFM